MYEADLIQHYSNITTKQGSFIETTEASYSDYFPTFNGELDCLVMEDTRIEEFTHSILDMGFMFEYLDFINMSTTTNPLLVKKSLIEAIVSLSARSAFEIESIKNEMNDNYNSIIYGLQSTIDEYNAILPNDFMEKLSFLFELCVSRLWTYFQEGEMVVGWISDNSLYCCKS